MYSLPLFSFQVSRHQSDIPHLLSPILRLFSNNHFLKKTTTIHFCKSCSSCETFYCFYSAWSKTNDVFSCSVAVWLVGKESTKVVGRRVIERTTASDCWSALRTPGVGWLGEGGCLHETHIGIPTCCHAVDAHCNSNFHFQLTSHWTWWATWTECIYIVLKYV